MQPLKGVTVVTLEHAIAAPFATRQLADLGARVIKIERPGVGDFARGYDTRVRGQASHFVWTNRSKESLTLDVKHPRAASLLRQLIVSQADVVVQNLAPGAAARLGVSFEALKAERPDLIVCDISGYGDDAAHPGPYRDKKAYDLLIQSEAGFVSITGSPNEPAKAGLSVPTAASWPHCCNVGAMAWANGLIFPCSKPWASGWATRCTTPSKAPRRHRGPAQRTPPFTPTAPSLPATARP
jgi:itaconate CoA-transferase